MNKELPVYPTSIPQQRIWFLTQSEQDNHIYNIGTAVRLIGPLRAAVLARGLNEIVRRHESLRTTFLVIEGQPVQIINPAGISKLPVSDLTVYPPNDREAEARLLLTEQIQQPFDLTQGPLFRASLLRLDDDNHILSLVMHHIVSDDYSMGVLFQELSVFYEAFSTGKPSPLPEVSMQYYDFVQWQQQLINSESGQRQLYYWKQRFADAPQMLKLPTDPSRHRTIQTQRGATQSLLLPASLYKSLKALSHQEGVILSTTLLAAFYVLLYRYTSQEGIVIGFATAGRHRAGFERLIGIFVNTLALRMATLRDNPAFSELLRRVQHVIWEDCAHQDLPFEKLVEELQLEWPLTRTPLFQVMFQFGHHPCKFLKLPGLKIKNFEFEKGTARSELTLKIVENAERLCCFFEYNTDLFDAATITRMGSHFKRLLESIVAHPDQEISKLSLLTESEQHQLLVEWNNFRVEDFKEEFGYQSFESQVERSPDAVAIVFENEHLTYRELNARANQLAHHLQALGVGPDVLVGICMERSSELVVGILGIHKAGGACVPLDPSFPQDWFAFALENTRVPILLTQSRFLQKFAAYRTHAICLDSGWEVCAREMTDNPVSGVTSENLSFVFFTSGSTGLPKAVMWPHGKVDPSETTIPITEKDRHLLKASIGFTPLSMEVFWPLNTGGRMIIVPPGLNQDSAYLVKLIDEQKVTVINIVPAMLRVLLEQVGIEMCHSLRHVLCFGEPLNAELQERFFARTASNLYVMYGTTEAPGATFQRCTRGDNHSFRDGFPIGRRLSRNQIYLLSPWDEMQLVPIGVPGELCCSSINLARGYLNRPALTAEKFVPNPFSEEPGARMYKTGDLARYLPDGNIEFLGRIDRQVKIRGYRIELGEIEATLRQHPTVQGTVAVVREDRPGDKRLVAYVVPSSEQTATPGELRRFLKAKLPAYLMPSFFVMLDALPLMPNGKVDRAALPAPDRTRSQAVESHVAPRDELELQLIKTWEKVLGVQPIGVHDNFFELGGHSLLAVRLMTQFEKIHGENLPLGTLFQAPTVEQLADILREQGWSSPSSSLEAIEIGGAGSRSIGHKIARHISAKNHPYLKKQYHKIKKQPGYLYLKRQYYKAKSSFTKRFLSYSPTRLEEKLRAIGLAEADTVYMHSAFSAFNGFSGGPQQIVDCILNVIGDSGNLLMVSMAYTGSTADYLKAVKSFDVIKTESSMGIITELFRRKKDVVRSLSPAHPILAFGPDAKWIISDHDKTMYSCGKGSPFEKILELNAKALFFDVPFSTMTFLHYLEDKFKDSSPVELYADEPLESTVIDSKGNEIRVKTYVFSQEARERRSARHIVGELRKKNLLKTATIGNTKLALVNLGDVVGCAQELMNGGIHFYH